MSKLIKFKDKEFPKKLMKIKNPPQQIWADGNIELLNSESIAIVGSRSCTTYGEKWCKIFTKNLLKYDLTIVSGMATGIDSIAHETALKYGGKTIAVLPSGFDNPHYDKNEELYNKIITHGGLIVSEFPPNDISKDLNYIKRNRIISGLGIATLVVEAAYRSGAGSTGNLSIEQEKPVFCIPGNLENSKSVGTNKLIQKGAKLVTCVEDITNCFEFLNKKIEIKEEIEEISEEYKDIYNLILKKPVGVNEIVKTLNISVSEVMAKITMMELDEKIYRGAGNVFFKKNIEI